MNLTTPGGASDGEFIAIGAGSAAYALANYGLRPRVLESDGIARTETYRGYSFDMGGHRFFTKVQEIYDLRLEILGDDFVRRPRLSRIYYKGRFFDYPLRIGNALTGLGLLEALRILASYGRARLLPDRREDTFDGWVTNRFGRRLFEIFFKSYTEKVGGMPCSEIRAEWAAQRIRDLSLRKAVMAAFVAPRSKITSLIDEFHYPRRGPGMMWRAAAERVAAMGGSVMRQQPVVCSSGTGCGSYGWSPARRTVGSTSAPAGP